MIRNNNNASNDFMVMNCDEDVKQLNNLNSEMLKKMFFSNKIKVEYKPDDLLVFSDLSSRLITIINRNLDEICDNNMQITKNDLVKFIMDSSKKDNCRVIVANNKLTAMVELIEIVNSIKQYQPKEFLKKIDNYDLGHINYELGDDFFLYKLLITDKVIKDNFDKKKYKKHINSEISRINFIESKQRIFFFTDKKRFLNIFMSCYEMAEMQLNK